MLKMMVLSGYLDAISNSTPILASILLFSIYAYIEEEEFKPSKAYSVLAYFNILVVELKMFSKFYLNLE